MKQYAERILNFVLDELKNRDLINNDEYDELFGCASFDEITAGINNILEEIRRGM